MANIKDKERILTAARERQNVTYNGISIRLSINFSIETLQARRKSLGVGEVRRQRLRLAAATETKKPPQVRLPNVLGRRRNWAPAPEAGGSHRDQEVARPMIPGCSQPQKPQVRLPNVLGRRRNWAPAPEAGCSHGDQEATCPMIPGLSQPQKP
ncbi:hypothetical protein QTO34_000596 [Cnephaeus nilssonii]|uniref:Uncharacterized protein n=1 Tax=Cnephaeus nilssonii TaxID=3371016 RepID=A0AA40ICC3_CNENI|nr:hypothetical protein QTO34_000596 [Eptesicus nilssonii]